MMLISLSILDYEPDLAAHVGKISESRSIAVMLSLIQTGKIDRVHIDVMKPPMILNRTTFPAELIGALYRSLRGKIPMAAHLMVDNPYPVIDKIRAFMPRKERSDFVIFIQRESFSSEVETIMALNFLKECNFLPGICLDLPTSTEVLTANIIEASDMILLMTVPMGAGGQEYSEEGSGRITLFSQLFPSKTIVVDGGITPKTIVEAEKAGAKIAVVGSFITRNENPIEAVFELEQSLRHAKG
jgi:ribulose-phosphate 3-epimerase